VSRLGSDFGGSRALSAHNHIHFFFKQMPVRRSCTLEALLTDCCGVHHSSVVVFNGSVHHLQSERSRATRIASETLSRFVHIRHLLRQTEHAGRESLREVFCRQYAHTLPVSIQIALDSHNPFVTRMLSFFRGLWHAG
jgi:hypothetical protein